MGRFSDFERKVDEMAVLSEIERKLVRTWLLTLAASLAYIWWIDGLPLERNYCWYEAEYGGDYCTTSRSDRFVYARDEWRYSNLTPTIEILIAAVGVLVLLIAYLRIWKRPDES